MTGDSIFENMVLINIKISSWKLSLSWQSINYQRVYQNVVSTCTWGRGGGREGERERLLTLSNIPLSSAHCILVMVLIEVLAKKNDP
jgi:hypothetical protein